MSIIRDNQIHGLLEASKHVLIAGFLINFRNANNDTFFINIIDFIKMRECVNKKSFNTKDLIDYNAIKVNNTKKRTRYVYNIDKMISEIKKDEVNYGSKIKA